MLYAPAKYSKHEPSTILEFGVGTVDSCAEGSLYILCVVTFQLPAYFLV